MLEYGLVERHRDVFLGLEANRRGDLLVVRERREVERPHDDSLVGHPDADAFAELVLREHLAQHAGQSFDVDDLAVPDHAGSEGNDSASIHSNLTGARLDGCHVAGLDVETYDGLTWRVSHEPRSSDRPMTPAS